LGQGLKKKQRKRGLAEKGFKKGTVGSTTDHPRGAQLVKKRQNVDVYGGNERKSERNSV